MGVLAPDAVRFPLDDLPPAMSLSRELARAVLDVPDCLGAGYVDLRTGLLLGSETGHPNQGAVVNLLAQAASDLFHGPNVSAIEGLFKRVLGFTNQGQHYFQEVIINSDALVHVFLRGTRNPDCVLVMVCRKPANLSATLTKCRSAFPSIELAM